MARHDRGSENDKQHKQQVLSERRSGTGAAGKQKRPFRLTRHHPLKKETKNESNCKSIQ
jgi:hypothetical protein